MSRAKAERKSNNITEFKKKNESQKILFNKNSSMIKIILCIVSGILAGYIVRNRVFVKHTGMLLSVVIMLLLFFLGVSVGKNEEVLNNFSAIGLDAFLLTVGGTVGSLLCAKWVYKRFFDKCSKDKNKNNTSISPSLSDKSNTNLPYSENS